MAPPYNLRANMQPEKTEHLRDVIETQRNLLASIVTKICQEYVMGHLINKMYWCRVHDAHP